MPDINGNIPWAEFVSTDLPAITLLNGTEKIAALDSDGNNGSITPLKIFDYVSGSLSSPVISKVKVQISSAEILNLFSTPKTIVPAQGAGKMIRPIYYYVLFTYFTTTYSSNNLRFEIGSFSPLGLIDINGVTQNDAFLIAPPVSNSITGIDDWTNAPLRLKAQSANPTVGNGTLTVYCTYEVITL